MEPSTKPPTKIPPKKIRPRDGDFKSWDELLDAYNSRPIAQVDMPFTKWWSNHIVATRAKHKAALDTPSTSPVPIELLNLEEYDKS